MTNHTITGGGNTKIFLTETGNKKGIPIVFIHGFNQCRLVWNKQLHSDLAVDFRLVSMDMRGHGSSEKPRDAYGDSALWADDVRGVIEELELVNPILAGWSYGGMVICDYLRYYGDDKIGGVNIVGARLRVGTPEAAAETGAEYLPIRANLYSENLAESIESLQQFIRLCTYAEPTDEDLYFFLGFNAAVPSYVRSGLMNRKLDNSDILGTFKKPFLVTHGAKDRIVLPSHAEHNIKHLKNVRQSFYENAGHNTFWEDAERFNRELREFAFECDRD